jgi:ribosome maturation factor RimP
VKEQVLRLIGNSLEELGVYVYDVVYEKEGRTNYLRVVLDSEEIIDMDKVVQATKIIDPLLDKEEIVKENNYILDVYAKSKGDE